MNAVAYIDPAVIGFINENLVPIRLQASDPVLGSKFQIRWTPTLLVLDADGTEHYRTLGFYPPQELIPSLLLGLGKTKFDQAALPAARSYFERIITDHPSSTMAPEAVFLDGVARYLESHDAKNLIGIYDKLLDDYPNSPWLTRADPYRFLKE